MNQPNKVDPSSAAEAGEGRPEAKENSSSSHMSLTQSGRGMSQGWRGVREAARRNKKIRFTALLHHVTIPFLRECFCALQRQAAPGVDEVTWRQYKQDLENRLADLHGRIHRGTYRAQPSRRVYIAKADGRQRPLGIAALEDKIVQRAVVRVLEQIYEEDFLGFSYGFRPGRGPHQALDALNVAIERRPVRWIVDADIRGFYDKVAHEWVLKFVQHRVADRRILRLIQKWLKAGVCEDGQWLQTKVGTPQGAVVSPLVANNVIKVSLGQLLQLLAALLNELTAHGRFADSHRVGHLGDHAAVVARGNVAHQDLQHAAAQLPVTVDRLIGGISEARARAVTFFRELGNQQEVAARLGISQQAVSQALAGAHHEKLQDAERAMQAWLGKVSTQEKSQ